MPPVKDDDAESRRCEFAKLADSAASVGKREVWRQFAERGSVRFAHDAIISARPDRVIIAFDSPLAQHLPYLQRAPMPEQTVCNQGEIEMRKIVFFGIAMIFAFASSALAQDPVKLHPDVFKVEIDNPQVRVMRVILPAHQKTDLHDMRDAVVVPLTDYESSLKTADGKTVALKRSAGKPAWLPAGSRVIEAGDKPVQAILIELKAPAAPPSSAK